jgi:hypothetical protein
MDDIATRLRRLEDRLAIEDLLNDFAHSMDVQDWSLMARLFADDIAVDHSGERFGQGYVEDVWKGHEEVMRQMKAGVSRHFVSHHVLTNYRIAVDGDRAKATCYLHSVHLDDPQRPEQHDDHGAWYLFELARTTQGWKMRYMKHTSLWNAGNMKPQGPVTKAEIAEMRDHLS